MKFRAIREFQGGNLKKNKDTGKLEWHGKQIFRSGQVISTSKEEVEKQMSLGRHKVTNRPMGSLLNHCKPFDKEAGELTESFYSDDEKEAQNPSEKHKETIKEGRVDLITRIRAAKTSELLSGLLIPGETRPTVMKAFNERATELAEEDKAKTDEKEVKNI